MRILALGISLSLLCGCQIQGLSVSGVPSPEFELEVTDVAQLENVLKVGTPVQLDFKQIGLTLNESAVTKFSLLTPEKGELDGNIFTPIQAGKVRFLAEIEGGGEQVVELVIIGNIIRCMIVIHIIKLAIFQKYC